MTIRFIGGMWRRIDGKNIRSFTTYQEAVDNKACWEDASLTSSDDIDWQINGPKFDLLFKPENQRKARHI